MLVVGILSALVAGQLLAAAADRRVSPWTHLPLPATSGGWVALLTVAALALVVLLFVELPRGERVLAVGTGGDGAVFVPAASLERLVVAVALEHAEVVRARARVRSRGGRLAARLWVAVRPLVDAPVVAGQLGGDVATALTSRTGLPLDEPLVQTRTLTVRQLRRYLP
jgi:hypothetical protein